MMQPSWSRCRPYIWWPSWLRGGVWALCTVAAVMLGAPRAPGQILSSGDAGSLRFGDPKIKKYRVGVEVEAGPSACRDVLAMVAIPWKCPEQDVRIVDEDMSAEVRQVNYRTLSGREVQQMLVHIPLLDANRTARAIVTFEVSTSPILAPEGTDDLQIPSRVSGDLRPYLGDSPFIETRHRKIRSLASEILADGNEQASAWEQVEAIYDYVLQHVEYVEGRPDQSALATLEEGKGDCHARTVAFIALARANKIPSRMVWVENHCYPEFYLEDAEGEGRWFPCQSAGDRAFGEMPDTRIIFQKGDNFRIPERPRDKLRYASDWARYLAAPNAKPKIRYIREPL